jgi:hypothetical protein
VRRRRCKQDSNQGIRSPTPQLRFESGNASRRAATVFEIRIRARRRRSATVFEIRIRECLQARRNCVPDSYQGTPSGVPQTVSKINAPLGAAADRSQS